MVKALFVAYFNAAFCTVIAGFDQGQSFHRSHASRGNAALGALRRDRDAERPVSGSHGDRGNHGLEPMIGQGMKVDLHRRSIPHLP
jgi:hypothetical protein